LTSTMSNLRKRILIFLFCYIVDTCHRFLLQFLCLQLFGLYYVGFKKGESEFFLLWCIVDTYHHSFATILVLAIIFFHLPSLGMYYVGYRYKK
jgi:hypothetical protein